MEIPVELNLEIRWKLLLSYYNRLLTQDTSLPDPLLKLAKDENMDKRTVQFNAIFLIEEEFLKGSLVPYSGGRIAPFVGRIHSRGITLVENLYMEYQNSLSHETKLVSTNTIRNKILPWIKSLLEHREWTPGLIALMKDVWSNSGA